MPAEFLAMVVEESLQVPARVWREAFHGFLETPDFSAALARVRVPALILWGDGDTYSPAADQEALRAAIPGARLIIYSGGGHAFHWEDPAQVAHDLVAFLYERRAAEQAQTERAHERVS